MRQHQSETVSSRWIFREDVEICCPSAVPLRRMPVSILENQQVTGEPNEQRTFTRLLIPCRFRRTDLRVFRTSAGHCVFYEANCRGDWRMPLAA